MAHETRVVTEQELRQKVILDHDVIDVIEQAFGNLAKGKVTMPPILSLDIPELNAEVDVKTAFIPGMDGFAIKVSTGFFNNPALGLSSLNGLMVLLSAKTGLVMDVFLDNGFLTDLRTAAAGAVATKYLAPETVHTAGVIGTGVQARLQMQAAHLVRPFARAVVYGRNPQQTETCALDISDRLGIEVVCTNTPADLVEQSQLVITTTPARTPVISADWLHPGLHITAMGSDAADKNEIDPRILRDCTLYACDSISQCAKLGELRRAMDTGDWPTDREPVELGQIVNQSRAGRQGQDDITICDLTGTGAQDTAIATHVHGLLSGVGTIITA